MCLSLRYSLCPFFPKNSGSVIIPVTILLETLLTTLKMYWFQFIAFLAAKQKQLPLSIFNYISIA